MVIWDLNDDYPESSRKVIVRLYEGGPEYPVPVWQGPDDDYDEDEDDDDQYRWTWYFDAE